jgi:hypothetical protein
MKDQEIILNGNGKSYNYSQDHCFIKLPSESTNGELCFVEDLLKPVSFGKTLPQNNGREVLYH